MENVQIYRKRRYLNKSVKISSPVGNVKLGTSLNFPESVLKSMGSNNDRNKTDLGSTLPSPFHTPKESSRNQFNTSCFASVNLGSYIKHRNPYLNNKQFRAS